jgi:four helix bundle protein
MTARAFFGYESCIRARAMIDDHELCDRTFRFACNIVTLCDKLQTRRFVVRHLSRQLLDAGTSIGANLEEGRAGQTKPDFIANTSRG